MQRIPEPELMDDPGQARAYANADFESAHQSFVDLFQEKFPHLPVVTEVLDLGCGPCDITRRFARAYPDAVFHAVDGAQAMLDEAARLNRQQGMDDRIQLIDTHLPAPRLPQQHYDTIISNSLLHHLHNPHDLWQCVTTHANPLATIFIMDLMRPASDLQTARLVEMYAANEADILRRDFYHSLRAAFTPAEVSRQLEEHALSHLSVETVSDRHMIIYGHL